MTIYDCLRCLIQNSQIFNPILNHVIVNHKSTPIAPAFAQFFPKCAALLVIHLHPAFAHAALFGPAEPARATARAAAKSTEENSAEDEQTNGLPESECANTQYGGQNTVPEEHDQTAKYQYGCSNHQWYEKEITAFHVVVKVRLIQDKVIPADDAGAARHTAFWKSAF